MCKENCLLLSSSKDIVQLGCLAHARRKFFELKDIEPQLTEYPLDVIGNMYKVERGFKSGTISFEERKTKAEELQNNFKTWLEETYKTLLPASAIAKALKYSLNQWGKLTQYHKNENLQIDNNFSERCIKSVVIGRKNWASLSRLYRYSFKLMFTTHFAFG